MEIRGLNLWVREDKFLTRAATTANTTGLSMMASVSGAQLPVVGIHAQTVPQAVWADLPEVSPSWQRGKNYNCS